MDLHRPKQNADWDPVAANRRTYLQRIAATTRGFITPANVITIVGLALVVYGALCIYKQQYWLGVILITIGRLADLLDGLIADYTQTKNRVGEFVDAASDKLSTLAVIIAFFAASIAPWWLLVLMLLPQVVISLVPFWSVIRHFTLHPSPAGKYTMAATWACLVAFVLLHALGLAASIGMTIVCGLALTTSVAGLYVAVGYLLQWD